MRPLGRDTPDERAHLAMPGATDLQVNGGGGVLVNADPTRDGMAAVAVAHRRLGTAQIMATVITDVPETAEAAATALIEAPIPGIAGLHLEGPHIAPNRRGTHDAAHIRPLDARTLALLDRLGAASVRVLLTLAPERANAALLARAAASGAVLSAGHSDATAEQAAAAFAAGVGMVTHLFNAMPPLHHRAPGLAAQALVSGVWAGLIADGIHVAWPMLRLALAAAPQRCFLVSDAMPTVGGPDRFDLYGRTIRVEDDRLVNAEGALAGAHVDLITCVRRLHHDGGVPLDRCIAMATDRPRQAMGLPPLAVAPGTPARDIALLDERLTFAGWLG